MRRALLLAATLVAVGGAAAAPFTPVADQHYRTLLLPVETAVKPGQVEVLEFYSLGCPHCAEFEPYVQAWLKRKPANVVFKRVPATFQPPFVIFARVHFALEDIGALEKMSPLLFEEIHGTDRTELRRPLGEWQNLAQRGDAGAAQAEQAVYAAIGRYIGKRGADEKRFMLALKSPSMNIRLSRAEGQYRAFGVLGVPAFGVNGKYFTTAGRPLAVRNFNELLATLDHLIAAESKAAKRAPAAGR